jgi:hypothetical protein
MKKFLRNLSIRPVFNKRLLFVGVCVFGSEEGIYLIPLPTLGLIIRWDGHERLVKDLAALKWSNYK